MKRFLVLLAAAVFLRVSVPPSDAAGQSRTSRDFSTLNVCQLVPGDVIARALGGTFAEARPFADKSFSRCTYFILPPGRQQRLGYVVWINPAADHEELKKNVEEPVETVPGLGDAAYMFKDKGDGRYKIQVLLRRGDVTFQATADSAQSARKIAGAVAARLSKKAQ